MILIDFEYNQPSEAHMGLVSMCAEDTESKQTVEFWLLDSVQKAKAKAWLEARKGQEVVAYAVELAESRCFVALGLDPLDFIWRDLMVEWRWLRNGDDRYSYGKVVQGFSIAHSTPPKRKVGKKASKAEREEAKQENMAYAESQGFGSVAEAGKGLLDCLVFFGLTSKGELFQELTTKTKTRDIIIAGQDLESHKEQIMRYNLQDIAKMRELAEILTAEMEKVLDEPHVYLDRHIGEKHFSLPMAPLEQVKFKGGVQAIQHKMGRRCARYGKYAMRGLPLDMELLDSASDLAEPLMDLSRKSFNAKWGWDRYVVDKADVFAERLERQDFPADFEDLVGWLKSKRNGTKTYPFQPIVWKESSANFAKFAEQYASQHGFSWKKTESGAYAADKEYLESLAESSDECPIKGYLRQTKEIDAINGIKPGGKLRRTFGSDGIHRYAVDPYATQTARNGQGASRFIFSAPHWFRAFIKPREGTWIVDLDFASQEIFIAASASNDAGMYTTYHGGDPYWSFAQLTGAIPPMPVPTEEQRSQEPWSAYKKTRGVYKAVLLGVGFGMGPLALAQSVSKQTGQNLTKQDGADLIEDYAQAYPSYWQYRSLLKELYFKEGYGVMLPDGWRMGNDNPTPNSVLNLPIQGTASLILDEACEELDAKGITVLATMHDAVTLQVAEGDPLGHIQLAVEIMQEAAEKVLGEGGMRVGNPEIVTAEHHWIHSDRAKADWAKYGKHLLAGKIVQ